MEFLDLLWWLVAFHFLCDFALQNDYIAINKNPVVNGNRNEFWMWCMSAHCMIQSIPVMWLTGSVVLSAIMFVSHFAIDYIKCRGKITYHIDQVLHIGVLVAIALLAVSR